MKNPHQIAVQSVEAIKNVSVFIKIPKRLDANVAAIIEGAIKEGRGITTTEYVKGWDDHVAAVRAAHASEQLAAERECPICGADIKAAKAAIEEA